MSTSSSEYGSEEEDERLKRVPNTQELKGPFNRLEFQVEYFERHSASEDESGRGVLATSVIRHAVACRHAAEKVQKYLLEDELKDFELLYGAMTKLLAHLEAVKEPDTVAGQNQLCLASDEFANPYSTWMGTHRRRTTLRADLDQVLRWCQGSNLLRLAKIIDGFATYTAKSSASNRHEFEALTTSAIVSLGFFVQLSAHAELSTYLSYQVPKLDDKEKLKEWRVYHGVWLKFEDLKKHQIPLSERTIVNRQKLARDRDDHDYVPRTRFPITLPVFITVGLGLVRRQAPKTPPKELTRLVDRLISERGRQRVGPDHARKQSRPINRGSSTTQAGPSHEAQVHAPAHQEISTTPAYEYEGNTADHILRIERLLLEPLVEYDVAILKTQLRASIFGLAQNYHAESTQRVKMWKWLEDYNREYAELIERAEELRKRRIKVPATGNGLLERAVTRQATRVQKTRSNLQKMLKQKLQKQQDIIGNVRHMWSKPGLAAIYRKRTSEFEHILDRGDSWTPEYREIVAKAKEVAAYLTTLVGLADIDSCLDMEHANGLAMRDDVTREMWLQDWGHLMMLYQGYYDRKGKKSKMAGEDRNIKDDDERSGNATTTQRIGPPYGHHFNSTSKVYAGLREPFGNFEFVRVARMKSGISEAGSHARIHDSIGRIGLGKVDHEHEAELASRKRRTSEAKLALESSIGRRPKPKPKLIPNRKTLVLSDSPISYSPPAEPMQMLPVPKSGRSLRPILRKREPSPKWYKSLGKWLPVGSAEGI